MHPRQHRRRFTTAVGALVLAMTVTACSGGGGESGGQGAPAAEAGSATDLSGVCPDPFVVQTDWDPESEYAALYQMLGPDHQVDTAKKVVTGPLVAGGKNTGIDIEIRVGGPAIGYQQVSAQMYLDKTIHLGQVNTDSAVQFAAKQPTLAVVAPLEISPFMLMWDPETHPQFNSIIDIGQTDVTVLYYETDTYMEYLVGSGILRRSQIDGSYKGTPDRFIAESGKIVQAGFATSEPYIYEHEVKAWGKPVEFALVNDTNYPIYPQALSIRPADKQKLAPCLEKLVPIIQQAQIDYLNNPGPTNEVIIDLVKQYQTGWQYSEGLANYAVKTMKDLGIVSNGTDQTLGNFDPERVQRIIDIVTPILQGQNREVKQGLKPEDVATNEFVDDSIGLPAS